MGLKEHYVQSRKHHYCQNCIVLYPSQRSLLNHYKSDHHYCEMHGKIFTSAEGLRQHYIQSGEHFYCRICPVLCEDAASFLDHGEDYHFVCRACCQIFSTSSLLASHDSCTHHYCAECDRTFRTRSNLEHHLGSSIHKPRNVICPGRGCGRGFVSASALILHAESVSCAAGITRQIVNDYVVRLDRNNVITNPARLITGPSGARSAPSIRNIGQRIARGMATASNATSAARNFGPLTRSINISRARSIRTRSIDAQVVDAQQNTARSALSFSILNEVDVVYCRIGKLGT